MKQPSVLRVFGFSVPMTDMLLADLCLDNGKVCVCLWMHGSEMSCSLCDSSGIIFLATNHCTALCLGSDAD